MSINAAPQSSYPGTELQPGSRIALAILGGAIIYFATDPASKAILAKFTEDPVFQERAVRIGQAVLALMKPIG